MIESPPSRLGTGRILRFWWPLASTWILMALEGVFLAAVVARLSSPVENLAAYGVSYAIAILVESPVILLMSASTALGGTAAGYRALWRFTRRLNLAITAVMAVLLIPTVFGGLAGAMRLDAAVAELVRGALWWLLLWPAAIGDRRFHQGLLIRGNRTGRVAVGTVTRLVAMTATALIAATLTSLPGASVAAVSLSVGVVTEMLVVRWMARSVVRRLRDEARLLPDEPPEDLTQSAVLRFYVPMALTSMIALAAQPIITFFMGLAPRSLESLAVLPVVHSLTFLFRALGLSYQETAIALLGDGGVNYREVRNVVSGLMVAVAIALSLIAFTPLADLWLRGVQDLDGPLAEFARLPLQIYAIFPTLSVLQSFQRALLVHGRATGPLGRSTAVEILTLAVALVILVSAFRTDGAVAAAIATILGRLAGLWVLMGPSRRVVAGYRVPPKVAID